MSELPPNWIKNEADSFQDGSVYIVALQVTNNETGKTKWEIDKIRVTCDEDHFSMAYADCADSTPYDAWTWEDFEYYIEVKP